MELRVAAGADGTLALFSEVHGTVATLSPHMVALLVRLARTGNLNPIAAEHMQRIVRQLPAERQETTRLGLTATADSGELRLSDAGVRLLDWLEQWTGWKRDVALSWGWQIIAC